MILQTARTQGSKLVVNPKQGGDRRSSDPGKETGGWKSTVIANVRPEPKAEKIPSRGSGVGQRQAGFSIRKLS